MALSPELENFADHFASYDYILPDGLGCEWVYAKDNPDYLILKDLADRVSKNQRHEIRIASDSKETINKLGEYLTAKLGLERVGFGGTQFFEFALLDLENISDYLPGVAWKLYDSQYTFERLDHFSGEKVDVLKSLMCGSFGASKVEGAFTLNQSKIAHIEDQFDRSIRDFTNKIYLVRPKDGEGYLGAFILKYLPALDEVQLHSVAGRSDDPRVLKVPNKLAIISAALFDAINFEYPEGQKFGANSYIEYSRPTKLTFSSSGAAPLYEALGFERSKRSGLVIKPKNLNNIY